MRCKQNECSNRMCLLFKMKRIGEEISFQVLIHPFVWRLGRKTVHTYVVWICLNYIVISSFIVMVLDFCSFLVVEVEVLMPRKVVSICTVCRGGGGVVYSSRITVKTLFHSLAVGQTI